MKSITVAIILPYKKMAPTRNRELMILQALQIHDWFNAKV